MTTRNLTWGRNPNTSKLDSRYDENGNIKVVLLGRADFSVPLPPPTLIAGYTFGVSNGAPYIENGALRMDYPALIGDPLYQGGIYNGLHFDVPNGHKELYIKFRAKMPNAKHGLKFCKVFGRSGTGYANTTFALDFTGADNAGMHYVGFGDGSGINNDTAQLLYLNGSNPTYIGRSYGNGAVVTSGGAGFPSSSWGTGWHTFRLKIKFNSGTTAENEINDGEILVNIDGVDYVHATGLFNRHYSNGDIAYISFGDWTQAPFAGSPAFDIHYDDIFISRHGFYEGA